MADGTVSSYEEVYSPRRQQTIITMSSEHAKTVDTEFLANKAIGYTMVVFDRGLFGCCDRSALRETSPSRRRRSWADVDDERRGRSVDPTPRRPGVQFSPTHSTCHPSSRPTSAAWRTTLPPPHRDATTRCQFARVCSDPWAAPLEWQLPHVPWPLPSHSCPPH